MVNYNNLPICFTWVIVAKGKVDLTEETQVQYDDILIGLDTDENGPVDVVALKIQNTPKTIVYE